MDWNRAARERIARIYESMIAIVKMPEFDNKNREEGTLDVAESLGKKRDDVLKTDCPIVFGGESSSGKSTVLNSLIKQNILPIRVTHCTKKVCRIRNSDTLSVSVSDKNGQGKPNTFETPAEMATFLKGVARTEDKETSYLDICLSVPMLEKNMILVDTPGIADSSQEDVAKLMMDYFPNALAVVFVVNVANAGGIQGDRICRIIEHVKNSKKDMICYDPEDTLFLLNKWDSIPDEEQRKEHFEEAKHSIHKIWEEITDSHILRISAAKPLDPEYKGLFDDFKRILEEIIAKNENKRLKKHQKYLKNFLEELTEKVENKISIANDKQYQCEQNVKSLKNQVSEMKELDEKMETFVLESFEMFVDEAADGCYQHLKSSLLKEKITKDTDKITRFEVGENMLEKIREETLDWQKQNLKPTMQNVLMKNLKLKFNLSKMSLDLMEKQMQKMDVNFDPKGVFFDALATFLKFTTAGVASGAVLVAFSLNPVIALCLVGAVSGIGYIFQLEDFRKLRDKEYDKIVDKIGKYEIADQFRKWYKKPFSSIVIHFLQRELKDLQIKLDEMKQTNDELDKRVKVLLDVKLQISKCKDDLYD